MPTTTTTAAASLLPASPDEFPEEAVEPPEVQGAARHRERPIVQPILRQTTVNIVPLTITDPSY